MGGPGSTVGRQHVVVKVADEFIPQRNGGTVECRSLVRDAQGEPVVGRKVVKTPPDQLVVLQLWKVLAELGGEELGVELGGFAQSELREAVALSESGEQLDDRTEVFVIVVMKIG